MDDVVILRAFGGSRMALDHPLTRHINLVALSVILKGLYYITTIKEKQLLNSF